MSSHQLIWTNMIMNDRFQKCFHSNTDVDFLYSIRVKTPACTQMNSSAENVVEKLPLLGLAGLDFLPVGSSVQKVGESELGPHVTSKLIGPQLAFTLNWRGGTGANEIHVEGSERSERRVSLHESRTAPTAALPNS